jgi:hypothetical protein
MLRIVGNLLKALCPVITAPCENLEGSIGEMNLYPVAIELYVVDPRR